MTDTTKTRPSNKTMALVVGGIVIASLMIRFESGRSGPPPEPLVSALMADVSVTFDSIDIHNPAGEPWRYVNISIRSGPGETEYTTEVEGVAGFARITLPLRAFADAHGNRFNPSLLRVASATISARAFDQFATSSYSFGK